MRSLAVVCIGLMISFVSVGYLHAQNYVYATGNPTFSTQIPIENGFINVNNGDIHIEIPLATQAQRGRLQLDEKLVYDSRIWKIVQNSGYQWQPTNVPNSMGGWTFSSGIEPDSVSMNMEGGTALCHSAGEGQFTTSYTTNWNPQWTDPFGTVHMFPTVTTQQIDTKGANNCIDYTTSAPVTVMPTSSGYAADGSGYYAVVSNYDDIQIYDKQGTEYNPTLSGVSNPPPSSGDVVDSNGNYWNPDSNKNLVDTLGRTPVLVSTSGNHIYYDVLTYSGARSRYTVTTETVYYDTAFGQQAVSEASGSFTAIQSIQLPDGSSYSFTYGSGTSPGYYGELASVTLPTGGVIQYGYTNFLDSFQNENRWINTRVKDGGTTTFTPKTISNCTSSSGCQESSTVTSPAGNDTVYTFTLDKGAITNGGSWNTGVAVYQGSSVSGGKELISSNTQYTYGTGPIIAGHVVVGTYQVPTGETVTTTLSDVGLTAKSTTDIDSYGNPTAILHWDYYSGSAPSNPTIQTDYTYNYSVNGAEFLNLVTTKDGSGNLVSQTSYSYDQTTPTATSGLPNHTGASGNRGNLTTVSNWINSSGSTLNTSMTYDDAGTVLTGTDPNGTTTFGHDSTDTFVTSATPPTPPSGVPLTTTATYDPSTGLVKSATDPNGQTTTYKSYDAFGRPTEIDYPDGGKTTFSYTPTQTSQYKYQNASTFEDSETLYDSYGRPSRVAVANGQPSNPWYQSDTCYNTTGQADFRSYPYQGTGFGEAKVCSGSGDSFTYDALGRTLSVTHGDGTDIQYTYTGRAIQVADENGVKRITQTDGLGRTTEVCEISSDSSMPDSGSPVSCGTDLAGTGFITTYAYNFPNHTTTITQGAQTRVFQTDFLGRTILTQEPERGQTTYSYAYNSAGLQVTRQRPKANQTNPSVLTTTTTQYDNQGRVVSVSYNDGITPTREFDYDAVNAAMQWSESVTNMKGRLADMASGSGATLTRDLFSYDAMGRVTAMWQCAPSICGTSSQAGRPLTFAYDWAGDLTSESDLASGPIAYTVSPAGEVTSITNEYYAPSGTYGTPASLAASVQNGPDGPLNWQMGNGLYGVRAYDSMGRNDGGWVCKNSSAAYCSGGTKLYGYTIAFKGTRALSGCDTVLGQCVNYGYDDFNRLSSLTVTSGTQQNFTYVYDRYGNRWQQNVTAGSGPAPQLNFNVANNEIANAGYAYDAAGDMTNDGTNSYTYDAEGNVIAVDNGSTASYVYDALNRRVRVQTASATDEYNYDYAGRRISTWLPGGAGTEGRIYWGDRQYAFRALNAQTYFDEQNWLGTERQRTDYTGGSVNYYRSLPYGDGYLAQYPGAYSDQDNGHFTGMERDAESDTDHAQFRQYGNMQGRWMSPDPYIGSYDLGNPQSFDRYSYVMNNPVLFVDPGGLSSCSGNQTIYVTPSGTSGSQPVVDCGIGSVFSDILDALEQLFGFGPPSFNGSLQPRPEISTSIDSTSLSLESVAVCAADFADKYSIAGRLHALGIGNGGIGGFITNALGGNIFSQGTNLLTSVFGSGVAGGHNVFYNMGQSVVAGPLQGIPANLIGAGGPLGTSAAGLTSDAIASGIHAGISIGGELTTLTGTASTVGLTGAEYATGVGEIKFAVDAGTYALGLAKCAAGQ